MNLRNNRGYTGIDISIAILILVILIPIIGGIIYNISSDGNNINKKTYAVNLATNVLEIAKGIDDIKYVYSKTEEAPEDSELKSFLYFLNNKIQNKLTNPAIQTEDEKQYIIFTVADQKGNHYKVKIDVTDYSEVTTSQNPKSNVVKEVKTNVTYNIGKKNQNIEISTVINKK